MLSIARVYQRAKNGVHALQALLIFIAAAMMIAVFTKGGQNDGRLRFYFALCWICIPAFVYQTAFPSFERTKRFSNPYVHGVIDILYTILWFAAFICVLVWAKQGSSAAEDWDGEKDKVCDKFAWGPPSKCKVGQATGYIAIIIWLLFAATAAISIYGIRYYRANGSLPTSISKAPEAIPTEEDGDENYAFSSNPHGKLDQQQDLHAHDSDEEATSLHRPIPSSPTPYHTSPAPSPPIDWPSRTTPDVAMGEGWNRRKTPDLPVGENYYPVDTSYHGGRQSPYDPPPPPPQHASSGLQGNRTPSPRYETFHSNESDFVGGMQPRPLMTADYGAGNPFRDELGLGDERNKRTYFPDADYGRLGH